MQRSQRGQQSLDRRGIDIRRCERDPVDRIERQSGARRRARGIALGTAEQGGQRRRPGGTARPQLRRANERGFRGNGDSLAGHAAERASRFRNGPEPEGFPARHRDRQPLASPAAVTGGRARHGIRIGGGNQCAANIGDRRRHPERVAGGGEDVVDRCAGGIQVGKHAAEIGTGPVEFASPLRQEPVEFILEIGRDRIGHDERHGRVSDHQRGIDHNAGDIVR
ncbi:MAG: hypothetical protein R2845_13765 [Thermomicrobiales bacterium]